MSTTRERLDDWLARGLLDEATHATLAADLATVESEQVLGPTIGAGLVEASKDVAVEALGYLGAALAAGAAVILLDVPSWPDPALAALLAIVAAVSGYGAWQLSADDRTPLRRLASVLVAVATLATAGAVATLTSGFDSVDRRGGTDAGTLQWSALATSAASLAVAVVLYRRVRRAVAHLALGGAVAGVLAAYTDAALTSIDGLQWETESAVFAVVFLLGGLAWTVASEADRLPPAIVGTIAGTLVGAGGVIGLVDRNDWWTLLGLVISIGYLVVGVLREQPRLTVLGGVGVLAWLPATLTGPIGLGRTATAAVLLPVGIALLVAVLRWSRHAGAEIESGDA